MLAHVQSSAVLGIDAYEVRVEVDVSNGLPSMSIVGLPDAAVNESKERVRAAIKNSGFLMPYDKRVTINLAPADVRKAGPIFDLPIAIGLLVATGQLSGEHLEGAILVGELSLDGSVRPITGALPTAIGARERRQTRLYVPAANAREAAIVAGVDVYPVATLAEMARALAMPSTLAPLPCDLSLLQPDTPQYAGGLHGRERACPRQTRSGSGRRRRPQPASARPSRQRQDHDGAASALHSAAHDRRGSAFRDQTVLGGRAAIRPMWRSSIHARSAPRTTPSPPPPLSAAAPFPRPGEVSLAHHGCLFLDELPEFSRDALEVLRQPLEDGVVNVSRVNASYTYPADFCLIAAMNPCPCGYYGDVFRQCSCAPSAVAKYQKRISGPLLDRIDLHIEVPRLSEEELLQTGVGESSAAIRERVCRARDLQARRFACPPPSDPAIAEPPHPADQLAAQSDKPRSATQPSALLQRADEQSGTAGVLRAFCKCAGASASGDRATGAVGACL